MLVFIGAEKNTGTTVRTHASEAADQLWAPCSPLSKMGLPVVSPKLKQLWLDVDRYLPLVPGLRTRGAITPPLLIIHDMVLK